MKASRLIKLLQELDPEEEVYFQPVNSTYVEDFSTSIEHNVEVRTFWGPNEEAVIISAREQVGAV